MLYLLSSKLNINIDGHQFHGLHKFNPNLNLPPKLQTIRPRALGVKDATHY